MMGGAGVVAVGCHVADRCTATPDWLAYLKELTIYEYIVCQSAEPSGWCGLSLANQCDAQCK